MEEIFFRDFRKQINPREESRQEKNSQKEMNSFPGLRKSLYKCLNRSL